MSAASCTAYVIGGRMIGSSMSSMTTDRPGKARRASR
jgi:hypothetical protein